MSNTKQLQHERTKKKQKQVCLSKQQQKLQNQKER